jgi:hypothetical protein
MFRRWPIYDRVLVNLVDGSAINGLLVDQRGPLLILTDATLLTDSHEPAQLDGDVYIERDRVLFMQTASPAG